MGYVERSIIIKASRQSTYLLAKDMEAYPKYMPNVESVMVVKRRGNTTVTEWETDNDGTPITWTEEDTFDDEVYSIKYRLLEGDLDKFEGEWTFESLEEGTTKITLTCEYDFGIPELTNMIGPTLEEKIGNNCEEILQGIKTQLEIA